MLFEARFGISRKQVGTSALKPCHDIVLKGLKINSWRCAHYEIGARVGESGGRTVKNELNHGKMSCTTGNRLPFGGFDASSALRARF